VERGQNEARLPGVTVVGVGGLGSPVALTLAKQGYPLTLYDFDKVEEKNIKNQFYIATDVGAYKVNAIANHCCNHDPNCRMPLTKRAKVARNTTFYTPIVVC
jgi:tRNA A37 threonylcarbamoyladenosine dehydratase